MAFRVLRHSWHLQKLWTPAALREGNSCTRCLGTVAPKGFSTDELRRLVEEARTPRKAKHTGIPRTSRVLGDGGSWRCCDCGIEKRAEDFYESEGRLHSYCKSCCKARESGYRTTLRGNAGRLIFGAKHRSKKKGWDCNLDVNFILDLMLRQNGRCAYSGVPMEMLLPHSDWRMSLERLDNSVGYERQNCVLIAAEFNTAGRISRRVTAQNIIGSSKWSNQKVHQLKAERLLNSDLQSLGEAITAARMNRTVLLPPVLLAPFEGQSKGVPGHLRCSRCGTWKPLHSFSLKRTDGSSLRKICKTCEKEYNVSYRLTLRGHIMQLLGSARRRHRLSKWQGKWQGDFELDLDSVLEMLWSQQGRCFYSDVPLRFALYNVDWMMSLERLDNNKTYTKDNTVLVALEFNTSDHTKKAAHSSLVSGSSQWSRSKVQHIWRNFDQASVDVPSLSFGF